MKPEWRETQIPTPFPLKPDDAWGAAEWILDNLQSGSQDQTNALESYLAERNGLKSYVEAMAQLNIKIADWGYLHNIPYKKGFVFGAMTVERRLEDAKLPAPISEGALSTYFETSISSPEHPDLLHDLKTHLGLAQIESLNPVIVDANYYKLPQQLREELKRSRRLTANATYQTLKQAEFQLHHQLGRQDLVNAFGPNQGFVFGAIDGHFAFRLNYEQSAERRKLAVFALDSVADIKVPGNIQIDDFPDI